MSYEKISEILEPADLSKSAALSISAFAAEKVLHHFEILHPEDDRPRQAILAAKAASAAGLKDEDYCFWQRPRRKKRGEFIFKHLSAWLTADMTHNWPAKLSAQTAALALRVAIDDPYLFKATTIECVWNAFELGGDEVFHECMEHIRNALQGEV